MTNEFWINLPVKDIGRSKEFYSGIGFSFKSTPGNPEESACLVLGSKKISVMLFQEKLFSSFSESEIVDDGRHSEVLFSIDAEDTEEVNALAEKVRKSGGSVYAEPGEKDGWMYGCGFIDPDGHRWSCLFMDESKMPKPKAELQVP